MGRVLFKGADPGPCLQDFQRYGIIKKGITFYLSLLAALTGEGGIAKW
jgi:hypothetical protein